MDKQKVTIHKLSERPNGGIAIGVLNYRKDMKQQEKYYVAF